MAERSQELGIVIHAAHLHHGLRGAEADADLEFSRELAARLEVEFHDARVDTAAEARRGPKQANQGYEKALPADSIEGTARRLRYRWFGELMSSGVVDAVATAHTLDDQAETVVAKFLRGAWTEGLSGIHPVLDFPKGRIVRPFLRTTRGKIEAFLRARDQVWREDSTNRHLTFTRNRIRHELLPELEGWNPQLREHLAQMAELARDEEAWWKAEVARVAEQLMLRGRPVRGGGRASTNAEGIALDIVRLGSEPVAVQRRVLRYAAGQLEAAPDFEATEALRRMAGEGKAGQNLELSGGLRAERTHRELRLWRAPVSARKEGVENAARYQCVIPGVLDAPELGCRVRLTFADGAESGDQPRLEARLRPWEPGDRARLRHSSGPRKVKEILERMKVSGEDRTHWPVVEVAKRIVWMRGVELEPDEQVCASSEPLEGEDRAG